MAATHLSTTRRGAFNALRHQGILVTESWDQLRSMLEKSLSARHALLLAEPVHEASGASTDWYSAASGEVRALSALPDEEQKKARKEFSALAADIDRLAAELKQDPNPAKNIRGSILALALRYPSEEGLYMVGDQPVVTGWGFEAGTAGAQPEDLLRLGAAMPASAAAKGQKSAAAGGGAGAAASAAPLADEARPAAGFIWWRSLLSFLLGLLLLLALFYLAAMLIGPAGCSVPVPDYGGCSVHKMGSDAQVNPELVGAMSAEQEKERSLRAELEDLRRRLAERAALCVPPKEEKPEPEPPQEPPQEEAEEAPSLADLMPVTPEPPPAPEPPVEPEPKKVSPPVEKPVEKPKAQKRGEDMTIPEEARRNKDPSFLEGCWNSETGLVSTSGEPVTVQYCFDANGNGRRTVTRKNSGERCTGSVRARFDSSGRLLLDADGAPCSRGGGFVPHKVECTPGAGGKAQCQGQEQGRRNKWDARFRRS